MNLFDLNAGSSNQKHAPLAYRMRPRNLDEIVGQKRLLARDHPCARLLSEMNSTLLSFTARLEPAKPVSLRLYPL